MDLYNDVLSDPKVKKKEKITVAPDGKVIPTDGTDKIKTDWFDILNFIFLAIFAICCLLPFVNIVFTSFSTEEDYFNKTIMIFPAHFTFDSYRYIFLSDVDAGGIVSALLNSIIVAVVGVLYNMLMTSLGAYAMTKRDLPFKNVFFTLILITMFFGGGVIPLFLTIKDLKLNNSLFGIIIPFGINTFNLIVLRNFYSNVPDEVIESAKLDGAGELRILFRLVIPLSLAGIATIALFYFVERWNEWYWPMLLFSRNSSLWTLSYKMRMILQDLQAADYSTKIDVSNTYGDAQNAASIVIAIIPILCVYPFVQKYFVKGVMLGSVKS